MKNLDLLIPKREPEPNRFTWATVAALDPIRVQLDGETSPLDITPDCLVDEGWLDLGRRVWCQVYGRRVLILGQSGKTTYEHPDQLVIPELDGWIKSEAVDGWEFHGDGTAKVRTPVDPEDAANKEYVDTSQLTDYGRYWRTSTFSTPDGWADLPSPSGTDGAGGVVWDDTYKGFIISKPGIYLVTGNIGWEHFGTGSSSSHRRDMIIRKEDSTGSGSELARHGTDSDGRVACSVSTIDVVTPADLVDGVRFKCKLHQNSGSSANPDGDCRMRVARFA